MVIVWKRIEIGNKSFDYVLQLGYHSKKESLLNILVLE
jgi:hypothetical protein